MKGLLQSYRSEYPNQVHQLNFSISQNNYLLKNGEIKYQNKKFGINWTNYERTGKRHLVNFLIRDHFSNCFYAEVFPIEKAPSIKDFLYNAWRKKQNFEFCGVPKNLIVGRHIVEKQPDLNCLMQNLGINIELAQNGFATGIRSVRDWENNFRFYAAFQNCMSIDKFQMNIEKICRYINLKNSGKTEPNLEKWTRYATNIITVDDRNEFEKLFEINKK